MRRRDRAWVFAEGREGEEMLIGWLACVASAARRPGAAGGPAAAHRLGAVRRLACSRGLVRGSQSPPE